MQFAAFITHPFSRTFVLALAFGVVACKGKSELATVNGRSIPQAEFDAYLKHKHISPTDDKRRDRALDEYLERVALSALIEKEAESWWDKGWIFLRAETDALMESVCLFFEREIDPDDPPPD